jgi:hypothetical protein
MSACHYSKVDGVLKEPNEQWNEIETEEVRRRGMIGIFNARMFKKKIECI